MIYREYYINQIREFYDSDLIKIITGIRRSGKSIILEQVKDEIKNKTDVNVNRRMQFFLILCMWNFVHFYIPFF